ncbi:tetratricopeptide repeat protein [Hyphomicrobium sp.]|uniref:O-linked N-acetylglucosamine transferase family protein n=1 Tax=Hyphomicrobium sp. TaxID=82 RepID=UPI0025BF490F|nr:tetratricopeptide repeat protein [Hyphomicrobium sp.]MCC7251817.1 methyltransferase domain-containing protein [Hyphomicrobium sp.]
MSRKQRRLTQSNSRAAAAPAQDPLLARDFREAVEHLREGRLQQSEAIHRRILARTPRHAPSLHNLGLIAFRSNACNEAIDYIRQSLAIDPKSHKAWLSLAVMLRDASRLDEAISACRQCVALAPADAKAFSVLGNLLRAAQNDVDAVAAYEESLKLKPDQPTVLAKMGELLLQAGNAGEALELCRRARALDPDLAGAQSLERRILAATGQRDTAEAMIDAATDDPAERARLCDELATFLRAEKRFAEAVPVQRRATTLVPDRADYHFNFASALEGAGKKRDALSAYQAGLALEPERDDAYARVGTLLRGMEMHEGAATALEHAVKLNPELTNAHYDLGITYKLMGRTEEARAAIGRAIACAPDSLVFRFEHIHLRRILCDWDGLDAEEARSLDLLETSKSCVAPFLLLPMPSDRAMQFKAAQRFARAVAAPAEQRFESHLTGSRRDRRIRVGYVSADFFAHATAFLLAEVLEKTDRSRFELFAYCYSPDDGSDMRRRVVAAFDRFVDIGTMTDREAAAAIHADGIDILVDLKGYTRHARTEIFSYRPAPIQVNYLGYPGTMGADYIDYVLADPVVAPMEHQEHYTERIVHLPHCYQPNDRQRKIADAPMTRAEFGLPEDAFVFCSFNNPYKLTPVLFDVWMRLLKRVPGAVLWIYAKEAGCRENLAREAAARGVDPARLILATPRPPAEHLARLRLADLFLDTPQYNAHTTASDALWAGLPVLTCIGETFSGRVAASILTAMNLDELITDSLDAYERAAIAFAEDRRRLEPIRRKIAAERETAPLFDSDRYTRNLERAYETMVDIMRRGEVARPFAVVESEPDILAGAAAPAPLLDARAHYACCPLCDSDDIPYQIEARITDHPHYKPELPPTVKWRGCSDCGHIFAEGHLTPEARDLVFPPTDESQRIGENIEAGRRRAARIVERVVRYAPAGEWLDVGTGDGALLFAADEWGYEAVGTDRSISSVETLLKLGIKAYWDDVEDIPAIDRFSVVSMVDGLQRSPYPRRALAAVHRMMRRGGALFLSMPNSDTLMWRILDASGANPHWGDLAHYHIFTRERLVKLLAAQGFKFAEYNVGEGEASRMEVIAIKV